MTAHEARPELVAWHGRFVEALCARDTDAYLAFLAPDCTICINNALPLYSKPAIERAYTAYLQLFRTLTIDVLNLHGIDVCLSVEALLNYVRADGQTEVVQCAWFLTRAESGLVTAIRVYGNASRVFKPFIPATK